METSEVRERQITIKASQVGKDNAIVRSFINSPKGSPLGEALIESRILVQNILLAINVKTKANHTWLEFSAFSCIRTVNG